MTKEERLQELRSYEKEIMLRKAYDGKLCDMIYNFSEILNEHPDLQQETFNVWEKAVESPRNSVYSIEDTYSTLKEVIFKDRTLTAAACTVYEKALASKENDFETLCLAYETLKTIVQSNSAFAGRASRAFNKALDKYEEKITPKTPLKKFFQQLNDRDGEVDYKKQSIRKMREVATRFLPKDSPNTATKVHGNEM